MEVAATGAGERYPDIHLHTAELIKYRDERKTVVFSLTGGTEQEGVIRWFDGEAIHIVDADRNEMTLFKHAILLYRAK